MAQKEKGPLDTSFNPDAFSQSTFEGKKGDTRRIRLDAKEYAAQIVGPWGEKSKLRVEQGYLIADIVWQPDDEEQRQRLGLDKLPTVRQSIFLDVAPGGQGLDMSPLKNGDLNRLREAIGLNEDGKPWKFPDFVGRPARIKLVHKPNKDDPENPFQNVTAVTKLS